MKILNRPLVDGMILCKELGQDLFVLNESSRLLWQALAAGKAEETLPQVLVAHYGISLEVARQDCARALAEWRAAGLLNGTGKGFSLAGVIAGVLLRLEAEDAELAAILGGLIQPLLDGSAQRVEANQGLELNLKGSGEAIYLEERGDQPAGPLNRDQAIEQVLVRVTDAVYRLTSWRMGLHAASVDLSKGAVLLSGQSGSGKSTLSAALVLRGHRLLADDISFLSLADMRAMPFALPIVLKEGSWSAFPALEKALQGSGIYQRFGRRVRFLTPPADRIARQPATVRQILFPRFAEGANLTSEEIGPVAAISAIWQASCRIGRPLDQDGLEQLGRWLEETPAHRLTYGSSEEAAQWIEERLA